MAVAIHTNWLQCLPLVVVVVNNQKGCEMGKFVVRFVDVNDITSVLFFGIFAFFFEWKLI